MLLELACQVPTAGNPGVGNAGVGSEHDGLEAPPIAKWLVDGDDRKRTSDGANDRYCCSQAPDVQQPSVSNLPEFESVPPNLPVLGH